MQDDAVRTDPERTPRFLGSFPFQAVSKGRLMGSVRYSQRKIPTFSPQPKPLESIESTTRSVPLPELMQLDEISGLSLYHSVEEGLKCSVVVLARSSQDHYDLFCASGWNGLRFLSW